MAMYTVVVEFEAYDKAGRELEGTELYETVYVDAQSEEDASELAIDTAYRQFSQKTPTGYASKIQKTA